MSDLNIAGVVVLYYPDENIIENIDTYIEDLKCLYIFDNSEIDNNVMISSLLNTDKYEYISFKENKGLGFALDYCATRAKQSGFSHLLTMDQDSSFDDFSAYFNEISTCKIKDVALYGVRLKKHNCKERYSIVKETITSGNVLNLDCYGMIEGYNEKLFIDHIDFDLCYQFFKINKKIVLCNRILMNHVIGEPVIKKVLFISIPLMNHSPLRDYYMYRNETYCFYRACKEGHPLFFLKHFLGYRTKTYIGIKFLEDNSSEKTKMVKLGIVHGKKGVLGKYNSNCKMEEEKKC
ncbi:hypothetical protein [Desulfosporosinus sp. FKB]|uniref:hypothetical protein n=1 Tax=Desulfosporosinus sp. FKB TaxID=1969835 RepID=UPI000B49B103|nr:hypothetical protein [Desulfosporosinus sp. FKB]